MEHKEVVSRADFLQWRDNIVTKEVFNVFSEMAIAVMEEMLSPALISSPTGLLRLNELMGYRNALNEVMNFEIVEDYKDGYTQSEGTGI